MSVSDLLLEQVTRLHASDQTSRREDFDSVLWTKIEELGLPLAMCPEPDGGFALRWSDLFNVIAHSAACGEPTPLGETLIANALLCDGGAEPAAGAVFFSAWAADVPETARLLVTRGEGPALAAFSEPAGAVAGNTSTAVSTVRYAGALLRSIQIAGALQGALDLSVRYAQERVQFGRPLAKFQAIQHMLAQLANEAVATAAAAHTACAQRDAGDGDLAIAIAKLRAGRAVEKGAMLAHQIHGAIGVTMEYPLGRLTRNMWRWAQEFGDQREWAIVIGRTAVAMGNAWDAVIAASDPVEVTGDE